MLHLYILWYKVTKMECYNSSQNLLGPIAFSSNFSALLRHIHYLLGNHALPTPHPLLPLTQCWLFVSRNVCCQKLCLEGGGGVAEIHQIAVCVSTAVVDIVGHYSIYLGVQTI